MASRFDVLHFHVDQFHFPLFNGSPAHTVTTLHGRQDLPDLKLFYACFPDMPLVAISGAQRLAIGSANFAGTVLHGLPRDLLAPTLHARGGYLAFLGRISPEKRVDRAIDIARAVGLPLKISAKVDRDDQAYFERDIRPLLNLRGIEYIGKSTSAQKANSSVMLSRCSFPSTGRQAGDSTHRLEVLNSKVARPAESSPALV
jgi:glycosyltransferase involved in cell wall biosynthesis